MSGGEVQLVDLVKRFGEVSAVDGINVEIPGGEFFSLLGPSGCGKTTTLRLVAGFEQPTDGRILLDGVDMAQTPRQPPRLPPRRLTAPQHPPSPPASITSPAAAHPKSRQNTAPPAAGIPNGSPGWC